LATSPVIVDEIGFEPMTRQGASLFFRLVSHGYQRGPATCSTSKGAATDCATSSTRPNGRSHALRRPTLRLQRYFASS
jgi:hypothetical protein